MKERILFGSIITIILAILIGVSVSCYNNRVINTETIDTIATITHKEYTPS